MTNDRRSQREESPSQALHLFLEACRQRGGFELLAVADERGDWISAAAEGGELSPGKLTRIPLTVMGVCFEVCALGLGSAAQLAEAVFGTRRILAS
jgi:hypothetical protein